MRGIVVSGLISASEMRRAAAVAERVRRDGRGVARTGSILNVLRKRSGDSKPGF